VGGEKPHQLVRQSAKRERVPDVLELAEIQLLLSKLTIRERTLVLLDAGTGLRVSELLALRWQDVDFDKLELNVTRSIWHQVVGDCKTEASAKPVPLDSYMAEDLLRWATSELICEKRGFRLRQRDHERKTTLLAGQPHEALHNGRSRERTAFTRTSAGTPSATPTALC
jgi:integrase